MDFFFRNSVSLTFVGLALGLVSSALSQTVIDNIRPVGQVCTNVEACTHIEPSNNLSTIIPLIAYSLGANIIEKHFTDDLKNKRTDHQSSMDAKQIKNFVSKFEFIKKNLLSQTQFLKF